MKTKEQLLSDARELLDMIDSYNNMDCIEDYDALVHHTAIYLRRQGDEELGEYISDDED